MYFSLWSQDRRIRTKLGRMYALVRIACPSDGGMCTVTRPLDIGHGLLLPARRCISRIMTAKETWLVESKAVSLQSNFRYALVLFLIRRVRTAAWKVWHERGGYRGISRREVARDSSLICTGSNLLTPHMPSIDLNFQDSHVRGSMPCSWTN